MTPSRAMAAATWCSKTLRGLGVLVLLVSGCSKSEPPAAPPGEQSVPGISAQEVLQRMLSTYQAAPSYSDRAEYIRETVLRAEGVRRDKLVFSFSLALERPDKLRFKNQRVYPASQSNETFDIASDGALVRTAAGELPEQIHETLAPDVLTVENFIPEPNVREAVLQVSLENIYPQLAMLLASSDDASVFPSDENPRLLDQQKLGDAECYRVALDNPAGTRVLWIDTASFALLRMKLPVEGQLSIFDPHGQYSHYAVRIDYLDPQLGAPIDPKEFTLEIPEGAHRMRRLVLPPLERPAESLGKPVPEFTFTTLDGEKVTPAAFAGKVALLEFWAKNCPPCREHTPLLEKVYQQYKDEDDFVFYAVNQDSSALTNAAAANTFHSWGGKIPLLRDPQDSAYHNLGVRAFPHTILIGRDGRLQSSHEGMHLHAEPLMEDIRKLLAGEDIAAQAVAQYARLVERYEQDLKAAELNGSLLDAEVVRPEGPPRKMPQQFDLEQLWQSSAEVLSQPGDIQLFESPADSTPRLLVLDAGQTIVELSPEGDVIARHDLPEHQMRADGFLRVATDGDGRNWFAASGIGWQQVYVYNDQWQSVLVFPEEPHAGIGDVLFADLAGGNAPLLYVGYWGGLGIHGGTLDGRRVWANRRLDHVLQIAAGPLGEDDKPQAWCTSMRGTVTRLAPNGQFAGEMSVVGQTLTHVGPVPAEDSGLTGYCGLAVDGSGQSFAVGFDAEGEVAWRYKLPAGDYLRQVPPIHIAHLPGHGTCWLIVAADGSLHWLNDEGGLIDRCDYGSPLTGIASGVYDGAPWLWIASENDLTAWQVHEKTPEPYTETPTEE